MIRIMLWFDFEGVLFLENLKIRQPFCRIFKRGTKSNPIHDSKTKTLVKDIEISERKSPPCLS